MKRRSKVKNRISLNNKQKRLAKLKQELKQLIPFPTPSTTFLSKAILQGARVFLTSDIAILHQRELLEKQFGIYITDNYYEASDIAKYGKRRSATEIEVTQSENSAGMH